MKPPATDHVVSRLSWRIQDATQMGFHVRTEPLDGRGADWCQIGQRKILFLDLTQTAAEQLAQLDEVLAEFAAAKLARSEDARSEEALAKSGPRRAA